MTKKKSTPGAPICWRKAIDGDTSGASCGVRCETVTAMIEIARNPSSDGIRCFGAGISRTDFLVCGAGRRASTVPACRRRETHDDIVAVWLRESRACGCLSILTAHFVTQASPDEFSEFEECCGFQP